MNFIQKYKFILFVGIFIFYCLPVMLGQSMEPDFIDLSNPLYLDNSIDEIIQKRTSVREFTETPLTNEELSTILWNAYGIRSDGGHPIPQFKGNYSVQLYVLMDNGIYHYVPQRHQLEFYSPGDFRYIGQYTAPIQLGICWDNTVNDDENIVGMQIGAICQNIYHTCIALGLGTVTTAEAPSSPLDTIGLPAHHIGKIVMPVGNPTLETKYFHLPMWISPMPMVQDAQVPLTTTIQQWNLSKSFTHDTVTVQNISQFLWACYGYSYYLDHSGFEMHYIERHRTVPSAHGYYPLEIYTVTSNGIYWYIPGIRNNDPFGFPIITFQWKKVDGDMRSSIAEITEPIIEFAPVSFVICLNIKDTIDWDDLSDPSLRWIWTYEIGACAQNVLLNTEARGFSTRISIIEQKDMINQILNLDERYDPYVIISIG